MTIDQARTKARLLWKSRGEACLVTDLSGNIVEYMVGVWHIKGWCRFIQKGISTLSFEDALKNAGVN